MEDYKQKYEEALAIARVVNPGTKDYNIVTTIFPELKESNDEMIRKELLDYLDKRRIVETPVDTKVKEEWIAWLEKQGAQKPIDKIEPKFKVGDFIVHNNSGNVCQVTEIKDDKYCIWPLYAEVEGYLSFIDVDNDYHLWTIEDAKNGDILVDESKIFMYKWHINNEIGFYASFSTKGENNLLFDGVSFGNLNTIKNIHPATKVERDLLFQKIKEAGYKWNTDSKRFNWICD